MNALARVTSIALFSCLMTGCAFTTANVVDDKVEIVEPEPLVETKRQAKCTRQDLTVAWAIRQYWCNRPSTVQAVTKQQVAKKVKPETTQSSTEINNKPVFQSDTNNFSDAKAIRLIDNDAISDFENNFDVNWNVIHGESFEQTVSRWSKRAKWNVYWEGNWEISINKSHSYSGDYLTAVEKLIVDLNSGNHKFNITAQTFANKSILISKG